MSSPSDGQGSLRNPLLRALLLLLVCLIASCDQAPSTAKLTEPIHVIVPVYVIGDLVRQIGGDRVDVDWWVEDGQSLDDLRETPARRNQLRTADLIITRGRADPWTLEHAQSEFERKRLLQIDEMYSATSAGPQEYLWLDPSVGLELTDEITTRLAALEPEHEKLFRDNRARLRGEIIAVADKMRRNLDNAAVRAAFLTLDRGFMPIARRYSLVEARVEKIDLADPTPYGVKMLRQCAKDAGTVAIFVNDQTPGPLLRDWQARLGLLVLPLDALGSSAPGSGRSTYVEVLQYNFDQVIKGLTAPGSANAKIGIPATTPYDVKERDY
jgi:ABC-type Zn uptake system ZnuABC Zn-binding protein ZnuA